MKAYLRQYETARAIGVHHTTLRRMDERGWLRHVIRDGAKWWCWRDLVAFVQTPTSMLLTPDLRTIGDPALRAYAQVARGKHAPCRWWSSGDLAQHCSVSYQAIWEWRQHGWMADHRWEYWGGRWWVWCATPAPELPPRTAEAAQARRSSQEAARWRALVVAAVLASGAPPAPGAGNGWTWDRWEALGAQFGRSGHAAERAWKIARQRGEVQLPQAPACPTCGKALRTTRVCQECARGCSVPGCTGRHVGRGLCNKHFQRLYRHEQRKRHACAAD